MILFPVYAALQYTLSQKMASNIFSGIHAHGAVALIFSGMSFRVWSMQYFLIDLYRVLANMKSNMDVAYAAHHVISLYTLCQPRPIVRELFFYSELSNLPMYFTKHFLITHKSETCIRRMKWIQACIYIPIRTIVLPYILLQDDLSTLEQCFSIAMLSMGYIWSGFLIRQLV